MNVEFSSIYSFFPFSVFSLSFADRQRRNNKKNRLPFRLHMVNIKKAFAQVFAWFDLIFCFVSFCLYGFVCSLGSFFCVIYLAIAVHSVQSECGQITAIEIVHIVFFFFHFLFWPVKKNKRFALNFAFVWIQMKWKKNHKNLLMVRKCIIS